MRIVTLACGRADEVAALVHELRRRVDVVLVDAGVGTEDGTPRAIEPERVIELPADGGARGTAAAMTALEALLEELHPDAVLVCGNGDAAPAAALVAVKLGIPQVRAGAGVRSGDRGEPDEINRTIADRVCDLLLCADEAAVENLRREGLAEKARVIGRIGDDPRAAADVVCAWLEVHASAPEGRD